jgi:hypothetical protein
MLGVEARSGRSASLEGDYPEEQGAFAIFQPFE